MLRRRADAVVHSQDGSLQLEVEVKTKRHVTADWAARLLRNMIVHGAGPSAPYFMLALPDRIFLWDIQLRGPEGDISSLTFEPAEHGPRPDYEADAAPALSPYLGGTDSLPELGEEGLNLVVTTWLTDLLNSDPAGLRQRITQPEMQAMLFDSGLYDAAKLGVIATELALP